MVTIGELQLGVLNAADDATRARRAETLALARAADPTPISEAVMVSWARLVADCRSAGDNLDENEASCESALG